MRPIVLAALLAVIASGAFAADPIYKCKGADGQTIYSQRPCAADAQEVKVRVAQPNAADVAAAQARERNAALNMEGSHIQSGAGNCLGNAEANINGPMEKRVAGLQSQINALETRTRYANNNLAGAQLEAGLRDQIAGLQQAIATERSSAALALSTAQQNCETERRRKEDELQRKREEESAERQTEPPPEK